VGIAEVFQELPERISKEPGTCPVGLCQTKPRGGGACAKHRETLAIELLAAENRRLTSALEEKRLELEISTLEKEGLPSASELEEMVEEFVTARIGEEIDNLKKELHDEFTERMLAMLESRQGNLGGQGSAAGRWSKGTGHDPGDSEL
jgi:hypothetical protein